MPLSARRVNIVWLILAAVTLASGLLASGRGRAEFSPDTAVTVAVVVMAAVKCRLVIQEFMEARRGPLWLRAVTDTWLILLVSSVLGLYLS